MAISLLVSNWEGFPLSILESMRAGLPVIASNVGGVAESVQDEETGYLVPQGGVDLLRDRVGRLLGDPELRQRFGAAGRRRYEQQFTLDEMVRKTLIVYQDVLGRCQAAKLPRFLRGCRPDLLTRGVTGSHDPIA